MYLRTLSYIDISKQTGVHLGVFACSKKFYTPMNLTNIQIKNAQPKDKPYKLSDGKGLYLLIHNNGSKYWRLKYRLDGKEKLLALGVYPEVSLLEARKQAIEAKESISKGIDPSRTKSKINTPTAETFQQIATEWIKNKCKTWSESHHKKVIQSLETNIYPYIGNKNINSIEPLEMLSLFQKIEDRGAFETTRKTRQRCGEVFKYAIITGRCKYNPCSDLSGALQKHQPEHYPHLLENELPLFLSTLTTYKNTSPIINMAAKLLIMTGVRTIELRGAEWTEINLNSGIWEIPAERMKKRKSHLVPLSKQAREILKQLYEYTGSYKLVFPGRDTTKPISEMTIMRIFERMGYKGKVTGHGFRHTMSTILHEKGFNTAHIELQLAHVDKNSIRGTYNHALYLEDRRTMLQWYADHLDQLEAQTK